MLRYYFGGLAAILGITGALQAQQPAFKPAFVPNKTAQTVQQVQAANPVAPPAPAVVAMPAPLTNLPPAAMTAAPAVAQPIAGNCPPAFSADVSTACGEAAPSAMDCLCGPAGRIWIGAEYLLWTTSGNYLPPLATVANGVATNAAPALPNRLGALGQPGTQTVIGDRKYADDWRSGLRIYGGAWLNSAQTIGVEGDYFFLGKTSTREVAGSPDGNAFIYRPFINNTSRNPDGTFSIVAPFQDTQLVAYPGVLSGQVAVNTGSDFNGAGVNGVFNLCCKPCSRVDLLLGYRYLNLRDQLDIREDLTGLAGSANNGATFVVQDHFRTENTFHGVNTGIGFERRAGSFFLNVRGTVAFGNTRSVVNIDGSTVLTNAAGQSTTFAGGLLAQPSNIGRYTLDRFAIVPEIGVRLGVQVTDNLRVYVGYNVVYWSNVLRTGDVVDLNVNGSNLAPRTNPVGELLPKFTPRYSDFWAQGIAFGAQLRW